MTATITDIVSVKKARYVGAQAAQYNTYVTLKLQNVKSTTVTVKGANPCWEQDFLFETNDVNTGLLIEAWSKGMLWDRALGYHWVPLPSVKYSNEEGTGQWLSLEAELVMRDGEVVGTKSPTGHSLLVDCRFELPFDPENTEGADLQRKLEMLNNIMDQEARAEQARRQLQYFGHSGYSEDSDYTSDLNYPVGGQHANSSASQFRAAAHGMATPESSRENSYERDEQPPPYGPPRAQGRHDEDMEPLSYNSRPRGYKEYRHKKGSWDTDDSPDTWYSASSYVQSYSQELDDRLYTDTSYYRTNKRSRGTSNRRPSLERQPTLYDPDDQYFPEPYYGDTHEAYRDYDRSYGVDYYSTNDNYHYQDERYGQEDEDRQWDSGGYYTTPRDLYENRVNERRSRAGAKLYVQCTYSGSTNI
ncbi:phorbol ester/diacylglycerol-binding protein unc-13-like [Schistocerca gregaria]|uniref:phorbol ester/diacylglycerol-binding protein unc-13-like n=1 Tax=Schistocerca gregaria TaxID=7010 RepID=UPI00211ECAF1|nr:phorbol ester/diacylglycerol-binding protein unc-13-like [Schistocerca gregaria]